jgi:hypothetical protein
MFNFEIMKAVNILGHPVLLISIYLLLIIEGAQFGGLYILYLLLALPHGGNYAVLALTGIVLILLGYKIHWKNLYFLKPTLYLIGYCLMLLSLVFFFAKGGKEGTFELTIPLLSFVLFGICSICFLIKTFQFLVRNKASSFKPTT